jgi:hypothetical protein
LRATRRRSPLSSSATGLASIPSLSGWLATRQKTSCRKPLRRAYLGLSQLSEPARFGAWLCGIAVNLAKMRLRVNVIRASTPRERKKK